MMKFVEITVRLTPEGSDRMKKLSARLGVTTETVVYHALNVLHKAVFPPTHGSNKP